MRVDWRANHEILNYKFSKRSTDKLDGVCLFGKHNTAVIFCSAGILDVQMAVLSILCCSDVGVGARQTIVVLYIYYVRWCMMMLCSDDGAVHKRWC